MNKIKISKLKKTVFSAVADYCNDSDVEILCEKFAAVIDDHFNPAEQKSNSPKPYLASTGTTEKQASIIRTKGDSQRADSVRGMQ